MTSVVKYSYFLSNTFLYIEVCFVILIACCASTGDCLLSVYIFYLLRNQKILNFSAEI